MVSGRRFSVSIGAGVLSKFYSYRLRLSALMELV